MSQPKSLFEIIADLLNGTINHTRDLTQDDFVLVPTPPKIKGRTMDDVRAIHGIMGQVAAGSEPPPPAGNFYYESPHQFPGRIWAGTKPRFRFIGINQNGDYVWAPVIYDGGPVARKIPGESYRRRCGA